jgi:hypothetical protein
MAFVTNEATWSLARAMHKLWATNRGRVVP